MKKIPSINYGLHTYVYIYKYIYIYTHTQKHTMSYTHKRKKDGSLRLLIIICMYVAFLIFKVLLPFNEQLNWLWERQERAAFEKRPFSTLLVLDRKLPVGRSVVNHYWEHFDGIYFRPRRALPRKENSPLSILIQKQLFTSVNKGRDIGNHLE